jgi:deoxyribonuclease-4
LNPADISVLQDRREVYDLQPLIVKASALINIACDNPLLRPRSTRLLCLEMQRAIDIGAEFLVLQCGNTEGLSIDQGVLNVIDGLVLAFRDLPDSYQDSNSLTLLIENSAGKGFEIGMNLYELSAIRRVAQPYIDFPIGFCLNTCHLWSAGYDLNSEFGVAHMMRQVSDDLGFDQIHLIHVSDAKGERGSRDPRREHLGAGYIGKEGLSRTLNHPRLRGMALILETPQNRASDDLGNFAALKELVFPNNPLTTTPSKKSGTGGGKTHPSST